MATSVTLEDSQWRDVLNQLGEGSINRLLPVYLNIQQQIVRQQPQPVPQQAPQQARTNGEAHEAAEA